MSRRPNKFTEITSKHRYFNKQEKLFLRLANMPQFFFQNRSWKSRARVVRFIFLSARTFVSSFPSYDLKPGY